MPTTISDTGFYAVVNFASPGKEILSIGHNVGVTIYNPPGTAVIEPADLPLYGTDTPDPDAEYIRTPFEAFLQTLYGAGVSLTSSSVEHDLNADIEAAGLSDDYAKVQVADFMAFCGALKRYQTLKDGTQVDLLSLGPGDERPNLNDLQRSDDFTLMYGIIDHIGHPFCWHHVKPVAFKLLFYRFQSITGLSQALTGRNKEFHGSARPRGAALSEG